MDEIAVHFLNGISYGMILFLVASGLSLIRGVMGILNLAHGSLFLLGGYIGWTITQRGINFWPAALISGLAVGVIGLAIERGFLRRIHGQFGQQALLTLGLIYIIGNVIFWIWGPNPQIGTAPSYLAGSVAIGRLSFPIYRFAIMFIGLVVFMGLWWFQEKTRAGAIVRAGMDNKEMTMGLGINYGVVCSAIFFLGAFVAGGAGFIALPWMAIEHRMAFPILLLALIVMVVGGAGRIQGSLVGAIVIGLIVAFSNAFIPQYALFTPYIVFIIILLFRPSGLLGRVQ